jgi:ABC-type branched-subunit amino acid transport system substrate-binding protein
VAAAALASCSSGAVGSPSGTTSNSPSPAVSTGATTPSLTPSGAPTAAASFAAQTAKIGITLPLAGPANGAAERDAALLAIKDAQPIPGVAIDSVVLDHAGADGSPDEAKASADMQSLIADQSVLAVLGPNSGVIATDQIPMTNGAGLLQCSASADWASLTHAPYAAQLRGANPSANSFLRTVTPDVNQGRGLADFATGPLGLRHVLVADNGPQLGGIFVAGFVGRWNEIGSGTVVATLEFGPDLDTALAAAAKSKPDGVVFLSSSATDTVAMRTALTKAGLGSLPMLVNHDAFLQDPSHPVAFGDLIGAQGSTYLAYGSAQPTDGPTAFADHYRSAYGTDPSRDSAGAYACVQVELQAIRRAVAKGSLDRTAVRTAATDPSASFDTLVGSVTFNAAGDMLPGHISIYKANSGTQQWDFVQAFSVPEP